MTREGIAALLALGAALFIAIGNVIQQRSAHDVAEEPVGHVELFGRLLRDRRWWLGSLTGVIGVGLQFAALGLGSVLLVEVLLVTSLLFALPINARLNRHRLTWPVRLWAGLLAGSAAIIVTVGNPTAGHSRAALHTWIVVIAVLGPTLLLCVLAARFWPGWVAAVLLSVVSASSWAVFAVLTKGVIDLLGRGPGVLLASPELYGWAAVALAAAVFEQSAFRAGALTASLPTMTVVEPLVAGALSIGLLGEVLRPGRAGWLILLAALIVMVVAIVVLSRTEAAAEASPGR